MIGSPIYRPVWGAGAGAAWLGRRWGGRRRGSRRRPRSGGRSGCCRDRQRDVALRRRSAAALVFTLPAAAAGRTAFFFFCAFLPTDPPPDRQLRQEVGVRRPSGATRFMGIQSGL